MRADIHYGPERDEAPLQWFDTLMQRLTFDQLNYVACDTRPDHICLFVLTVWRVCQFAGRIRTVPSLQC